MKTTNLKAEKRTLKGRKVNRLRKEGILPGNIFGKKIKSMAISIGIDDFKQVFSEVGETGLVKLEIKGEKTKEERVVLVSNVQFDPVLDLPIHVDFHQVDLKEKVTADVPVELTGESPAEKKSLGTVVLHINEIEVEALPGDLPENFIIDISKLEEVDQAVMIKDLKIDASKVEIKIDLESIVVKVEPPQKEEVIEEPEVPSEGEEEVTEGKAKEGEEASEENTEIDKEKSDKEPKDASEKKE